MNALVQDLEPANMILVVSELYFVDSGMEKGGHSGCMKNTKKDLDLLLLMAKC